mmetsp:Transcript_26886/g.45170  ORF Transcript_26886/g.45170 Transcript_26886/m.45170 type:complete len:135 (+) Transcript_26886:84-488(+)
MAMLAIAALMVSMVFLGYRFASVVNSTSEVAMKKIRAEQLLHRVHAPVSFDKPSSFSLSPSSSAAAAPATLCPSPSNPNFNNDIGDLKSCTTAQICVDKCDNVFNTPPPLHYCLPSCYIGGRFARAENSHKSRI